MARDLIPKLSKFAGDVVSNVTAAETPGIKAACVRIVSQGDPEEPGKTLDPDEVKRFARHCAERTIRGLFDHDGVADLLKGAKLSEDSVEAMSRYASEVIKSVAEQLHDEFYRTLWHQVRACTGENIAVRMRSAAKLVPDKAVEDFVKRCSELTVHLLFEHQGVVETLR